MKHYGLNIAEGTEITNITIPTGTSFPTNDNVGELFFRTDENKYYIRNNTTWLEVGSGGGGGINDIIEDLSPQLGAALDLNGFNITSTPPALVTSGGGNIDLIASDGGSTSGDGGDINITGGDVTSGTGGTINIAPGGQSTTIGTVEVTGRLNVNTGQGTGSAVLAVTGSSPVLRINRTGASADNGNWAIQDSGTGYLSFLAVSDTEGGASTWLRVHRASGQGPTHLQIFDPFRGSNGNSSAPIYSFTSDTDAGMYYDGTSNSEGPAISNGFNSVVVFTAGGMRVKSVTAPSNDISGYGHLYIDSADDDLKYRDQGGTIQSLTDGGISNIIEDLSPQLGADLDVNDFTIVGKPAGATDNGGSVDLTASNGGATSGIGGLINIIAGNGVGTAQFGGAVNITSGDSNGEATGGDIVFNTGDGSTGGAIRLNGGDSTSAFNNQGGRIVITGGTGGSTIGTGGDIALKGGDTGSAGTGQGGYVSIDTAKSGASGQVRFLEDSGSEYIGLQSPVAVTTSRDWFLPVDDPSTVAANNQVLTSDASGNLSFADIDGGTF